MIPDPRVPVELTTINLALSALFSLGAVVALLATVVGQGVAWWHRRRAELLPTSGSGDLGALPPPFGYVTAPVRSAPLLLPLLGNDDQRSRIVLVVVPGGLSSQVRISSKCVAGKWKIARLDVAIDHGATGPDFRPWPVLLMRGISIVGFSGKRRSLLVDDLSWIPHHLVTGFHGADTFRHADAVDVVGSGDVLCADLMIEGAHEDRISVVVTAILEAAP